MKVEVEGVLVEDKLFAPDQTVPWHRHEGRYGCLMLGGRAQEERRRGGEMSLEVGDCSWRPPQSRHRFRAGEAGVQALTFEIPESRIGELADGGVKVKDDWRQRSGTVLALGHRLRAEMHLREAGERLALESLVLDLVAEATALPDRREQGNPVWLYRIRDRLHDEVGSRLGLGELAAEAGVHPMHLARAFRHRFGRPLGVYHRRLRLDHGLRGVIETDASLADIALASGFTDQSHFTNLVQRAVGIAPGRLRQLSRSARRP